MTNAYLKLVEAAFHDATESNIAAIETFEAAHPAVIDDSYRAAGKLSYELVSGTVSRV